MAVDHGHALNWGSALVPIIRYPENRAARYSISA
jgi:hypothetical protein